MLAEIVDNAFYQGFFRPNEQQSDLVFQAKLPDGGKVGYGEWNVGSEIRRACVSGGDEQFFTQWALSYFPGKSVFPASGSNT